MKNTVFIAVKRTDDLLVQLGLHKETDDYSIASDIYKKLCDLNIGTYLKDVGINCDIEERNLLKEADVLIVVATKKEYLNASDKIINIFEEEAKNQTKKIMYLCVESIGDLRTTSFHLDVLNSYILSEVFEISRAYPIIKFVKSILDYLNLRNRGDVFSSVQNILKRSCSKLQFYENATERHWLNDILDNWIKNPGRRHIFWLCGEHGSGKTIFIGDYCTRLNDVLGKGIYYCYCSSRETQNVERIIKAIAYEFSICINGYNSVVYDYVSDERFENSSAEELLLMLLIEPFIEHQEIYPINGKLVFVIDGIDELKTGKADALTGFLELLRNYSQSIPKFLYLIITSPTIDTISNTMKQLSVKAVDLADSRYQVNKRADAERFLCTELDELGIKYGNNDIQKVLEQAEWNFDYLHYFIEQCDEGKNDELPPLDKLPKGLDAMFELDFSDRFPEDFYNNKIKPILQILVATYEPCSVIDLSQILSVNINEVQSIIKGQLRQFLKFPNKPNQNEVVALYNMSLELWLVQNNHKYCINIEAGTKAIANWFKSFIEKENGFYGNEYLQKYGLLHILVNKDYAIIEKLILESKVDDFEKLKEDLSILFANDRTNQIDVKGELLTVYSNCYDKTVRVRDLLVYTYRYILRRNGENAQGLEKIIALLKEKHEEIRANLLIGEGISGYEDAKKHFEATIRQAINIVKQDNANIWWDKRMLGVAYNRLANLENQKGHTDEAIDQYRKGKKCFDEAIHILKADLKLCNDFKGDFDILQRDEAIINERLGDLAFKKHHFQDAARYYASYNSACKQAYNNAPTLNAKWDLSISLLRLGDAKRYLGRLKESYDKYISALELRYDILQNMRNDCMKIIFKGSRIYYKAFSCPEYKESLNFDVDEVPKESRDIEPLRDIAMCYVRLGDLAFSLQLSEVAEYYYDIFYDLCEKNNIEIRTKATENDLISCRDRKKRVT